MICKSHWKKTNSIKPTEQSIDPQGLLREKKSKKPSYQIINPQGSLKENKF